MKSTLLFISILFISYSARSQQKDNRLTPEEFASGWELLFDGETLKVWKAYNGEEPQTWRVKENSIYCYGTKGGDDIMSVEQFGDFIG